MALRTRTIVYAGLVAAIYVVFTVVLAPISYGPIQFRVAEMLKPLALLSPVYALAFGVGNFLANLSSPFGAWDFLAMPLVDMAAALICYALRRYPLLALTVQASIISMGVAVFPLYMGGGIPIWPTVLWVFVSEIILLFIGYVILRKTPLWTSS